MSLILRFLRLLRLPRLLRRRAARLAIPAALLLAALPAAGCGGGWFGGPAGTLEVQNDALSFEGIDAVEVSTPFGPVDHFDVFLAPGESTFIDLDPDVYDVDLLWSDSTIDTVFGVEVFDGTTSTVTGSN